MKRRILLLTAAFLILCAAGAVALVLRTGPAQLVQAADTGGQLQQLQSKFEACDASISGLKIDGSTVHLVLGSKGENAIEEEVAKWACYRVAAEEGFTFIEFNTDLNVSHSGEGYALHLWTVKNQDPAIAYGEVTSWVEELSEKDGIRTQSQFGAYRLDLVIESPREAAPAVAEQFMLGGSPLHDAGLLDILTIVIKANGETLFEGVSDYMAGAHTRLFQARDLIFE
jgi:hypothetical protein